MLTMKWRLLLAVAAFVSCGAPTSLRAQTVTTHDMFGTAGAIEQATTTEPVVVEEDGGGQIVSKPAGPAPTPRHTGFKALAKDLVGDVKHLPSKENAFWAGLGGGLALAVHPVDDNLNRSLTTSDFADKFFKPGEVLGELGTLLGSAVTVYTVGRIKDQPKVSHVGMDLIQSLVLSEGMTQLLKVTTHRERPDGSGHNSFPSGHAADTFAFATALERHFGWKGAVPAYMFASYVAISRLPANRHWFSDAVFGSTVGIIAGRTVTRHGKEFPVTVTATRGGVSLMYVRLWK